VAYLDGKSEKDVEGKDRRFRPCTCYHHNFCCHYHHKIIFPNRLPQADVYDNRIRAQDFEGSHQGSALGLDRAPPLQKFDQHGRVEQNLCHVSNVVKILKAA